LIFLLCILGCDEEPIASHGGGGTAEIDGGTYNDVQRVFGSACISCHDADGAVSFGGLDLLTDPCAALVGVPSRGYAPAERIVPGDPEASVLWNKMSGTGAFGGVMPPSGKIEQASIDAVTEWIAAGAPSPCAAGGDTGDTDSEAAP
jgi:mono/diheme cytochrome c family protein